MAWNMTSAAWSFELEDDEEIEFYLDYDEATAPRARHTISNAGPDTIQVRNVADPIVSMGETKTYENVSVLRIHIAGLDGYANGRVETRLHSA
jgi:hypothetical protein